MYLSTCVCIYLSMHLLAIHFFFIIYLNLYLCSFMRISFPSTAIYLSVSLSIYLSNYACIFPSVYVFIYLRISQSISQYLPCYQPNCVHINLANELKSLHILSLSLSLPLPCPPLPSLYSNHLYSSSLITHSSSNHQSGTFSLHSATNRMHSAPDNGQSDAFVFTHPSYYCNST